MNKQRLTFDIEGNGLCEVSKNNKIYSTEATVIWCISLYDIDSKQSYLFHGKDISKGVDMLRKASLIIGHNVYGYDIPLIERLYGPLNKKPFEEVYDTILVSRLMWPEITTNPLPRGSHSLQAWGEYLREEKQEYTQGWDAYSHQMGQYCVQDSIVTASIFNHQQYLPFVKKFKDAVKLEHEVASIIKNQVEAGFSFSISKAEELRDVLFMEKASIEDNMRVIFPTKTTERWSDKTGKRMKDGVEIFNPGSRQQIAERLIEKYNWVPTETEKGNPQVSEEVLSSLPYPEAVTLCQYFDSVKLLSQVSDWISRASISRDNKIHGSMNVLGTVTGRMTSKEPNMQQVASDPRARCLFTPSDGRVLVGADLKGLELRMLAHYLYSYDNGKYAEVVCNGDVHTHNKEAMGLSSRDTAKVAIYCFLYGGGDEKFGKTINCSTNVARKTKNNLLINIPGLQHLINKCKTDSIQLKHVHPFNFRPIPVRKEHAALNTLLQSSGALVSKVWTNEVNKELESNFPSTSYSWVANIHDELQIECIPFIAQDVGNILLKAAIKSGVILKCMCPIEASFKIGNNWSETH